MIYGIDKKNSVLKVDRQICPCCGQDSEYKLKRTDFVFSFFFIPCFPLGTFQTFAECGSCQSKYVPERASTLSIFPGYDDFSGEQLYTLAPLFKRGLALVIDIILLFVFNMWLSTFLSTHEELAQWFPRNFIFTFLIFWFVYFFVSELLMKGYTVGKRILSVRTSTASEFKPLGFVNNLNRAFVKTLSCAIPVVFIVAFWSKGNKAIHDWAGKSIVVRKFNFKK